MPVGGTSGFLESRLLSGEAVIVILASAIGGSSQAQQGLPA